MREGGEGEKVNEKGGREGKGVRGWTRQDKVRGIQCMTE